MRTKHGSAKSVTVEVCDEHPDPCLRIIWDEDHEFHGLGFRADSPTLSSMPICWIERPEDEEGR